jgi:hypothetical protein
VRRWYPEREIVVAVADGAYASLKLLSRCHKLKNSITFITRLRLDALPSMNRPRHDIPVGQMGRSRLKGERLANLSAVAEDPATAWTPITLAQWYGGEERTIEVASASAVW